MAGRGPGGGEADMGNLEKQFIFWGGYAAIGIAEITALHLLEPPDCQVGFLTAGLLLIWQAVSRLMGWYPFREERTPFLKAAAVLTFFSLGAAWSVLSFIPGSGWLMLLCSIVILVLAFAAEQYDKKRR